MTIHTSKYIHIVAILPLIYGCINEPNKFNRHDDYSSSRVNCIEIVNNKNINIEGHELLSDYRGFIVFRFELNSELEINDITIIRLRLHREEDDSVVNFAIREDLINEDVDHEHLYQGAQYDLLLWLHDYAYRYEFIKTCPISEVNYVNVMSRIVNDT